MRSPTTSGAAPQPPSIMARASGIAFVRVFIGIMWLFEITVGHNWKLGNPAWVGAGAGDYVREASQTAIADGTWAGAAWAFESLFMPNAAALGYLVIGLQLTLAIGFILGLAVRPLALAALAMDFTIFMLGNSRIPPFFSMAHIFLLVTGAGRDYGLDGVILDRTQGAGAGIVRLVRWGIELPLLKRSHLAPATAAAALVALFFFLSISNRETGRMANVGLDLAAIFGLVALVLHFTGRIPDRLEVIAAALRIFVGFKFLHEIWTRTAPGVNALPGFAGAEAQAEVYESVAANHWGFVGSFVNGIILPNIELWVVAFGAIQLAVGVMLLVGYRTRAASIVGLLFLGAMIALGMTRYAPFLFGLLVPVLALDAGRVLSLDNVRKPSRRAQYGLPIPARFGPALIAVAAAGAAIAAVVTIGIGIEPDGYTASMPSMTTAFAAIILGTLAFAGWVQLRPEPDVETVRGGEALGEVVAPVGA